MKENRKEYIIITTCPFCGRANEVAVNEDDYWDWDDGKLAQNAFPYLSDEERELLISGICSSCWSNMFPPEEGEEDDEEFGPERVFWNGMEVDP